MSGMNSSQYFSYANAQVEFSNLYLHSEKIEKWVAKVWRVCVTGFQFSLWSNRDEHSINCQKSCYSMFRSIKVATGTSFSSGTYFPVLVGVYVVFEITVESTVVKISHSGPIGRCVWWIFKNPSASCPASSK